MNDKHQGAREDILTRIRTAVEKEEFFKNDTGQPAKKAETDNKEVNFISDPGKFIAKLKGANASVSIIDAKSKIIDEVHDYVSRHDINHTITLANDAELSSLAWEGVETTLNYDPHSLSVSVTFAWMGIEETGSLVVMSSPTCPTGMNFLPEHHIVVLDSNRIVERMEDVWQSLRNSSQEIPRTINLITGPSRTADIEYKIQLGAHGPKYLHVILIQA